MISGLLPGIAAVGAYEEKISRKDVFKSIKIFYYLSLFTFNSIDNGITTILNNIGSSSIIVFVNQSNYFDSPIFAIFAIFAGFARDILPLTQWSS